THQRFRQELRTLVGADHVVEVDGGIFVGRRAVVTQAQRGDAGGMHDAPHATMLRRQQHVVGAADIGVANLARIAGPQPVIGGDVEQALAILQRRFERRRIQQIAANDLDIQAVEICDVARSAHQRPYRVAVAQQRAYHGRADESVGAADQDAAAHAASAAAVASERRARLKSRDSARVARHVAGPPNAMADTIRNDQPRSAPSSASAMPAGSSRVTGSQMAFTATNGSLARAATAAMGAASMSTASAWLRIASACL